MSIELSKSIESLTREFETITHNLANTSTVGYKRRYNSFAQSFEALKDAGLDESANAVEHVMDFSQGHLVQTQRPLDFAIYGEGFFVAESRDGALYTRNGMFMVNKDSHIVDGQGRTISGEMGAITIPPGVSLSQLNVSEDGTISANGIKIDRLKVVRFEEEDKGKLVPVGGNCFAMSDEDVRAKQVKDAVVKHGFEEASNVNMVEELVDMIMVSRLYESNMKFVTNNRDTTSSLMTVAMG
jgi:flagellar basal-body rod protein FlgG